VCHPFINVDHPSRHLLCELLQQFYHLGWVTGTGGGMAIRDGEAVLLAPSGAQTERLKPSDLFVLSTEKVEVLFRPEDLSLKVSECQPIFWEAFNQRDAGAVLHSHSINAVMVTRLFYLIWRSPT